MSGVRVINMNANFRREKDASLTVNFTLTGLESKEEAEALFNVVKPKLQRAIAKTIKRRGNAIFERRDG